MEPSEGFKYHTDCPKCGSSDANAVYEGGTTYCFSCQNWEKIEEDDEISETFDVVQSHSATVQEIGSYAVKGFRERQITKQVAEYFGVRVRTDGDEVTHHYYPYQSSGRTVAYKERIVDGKKFKTIGQFKGVDLFGMHLFKPGGRKIIVTEGEIDAMAVAQAHLSAKGDIYPVVSIPNGASALSSVLHNRDYLRSFDEVILMMDSDEPGLKAQSEVAKMVGADKVKIANLSQKDASDELIANGAQSVYNAVWNAQTWCPAGVISSSDTWNQYAEEQEAVYVPWPKFVPGLNDKIYGRRLGSITTFTSGTGSGKTSFLREDAYHLLQHTDAKIGICSLEESVAETVRGFISLDLSKRVGIPGVEVSLDDQRGAWERTMGTDRFLVLDHQGSVSDDSLIDKLEYMANVCDFIYLDHITIAVSEVEGSINAAMDKFMSDLLKVCKRHNVWFGVVSHLRKSNQDQSSFEQGAEISEDSMKGSGSLKQISAQIIALERNKHAESEAERHRVKVRVLKDRFGGDTGTADHYKFSFETGRLSNADPEHFVEVFDEC